MEQFPLPTSLINWLLLAALIIPIAITALSFKPAVRYLKAHINGRIFEILRQRAHMYVASLEQDPTLGGLANEEKKQQAVIWLVVFAARLGIKLSEQDASNLVEEAVYLVKKVTLPAAEDVLQAAAAG